MSGTSQAVVVNFNLTPYSDHKTNGGQSSRVATGSGTDKTDTHREVSVLQAIAWTRMAYGIYRPRVLDVFNSVLLTGVRLMS